MKKEAGKMAAVGPGKDVLPFLSIGAAIVSTEDLNEARDAVRRFAGEGYAIIFVSDDLLTGMEDILSEYAARALPAVSAIPGRRGKSHFMMERLGNAVRKAIGIEIEGITKS